MKNRVNILVADDNYATQKLICTILRKKGYSVFSASNGIEVLTMVSQQPFALIIMDCNMPQMNGLEATKKIRNDMNNRDTVIIGSTTVHSQIDIEELNKIGMNDFLAKPISGDRLISCIQKWVS